LILPAGTEVVVIVGRGSTVIDRLADWFGNATDVASTVTVRAAETLVGALYVVVFDVIRLRIPAPVAGDRLQVTPEFDPSFDTLAVIARVWFSPRVWDALGVKLTA